MKTIQLFFATLLISSLCSAQITITSADLPRPGQGDIVAFDTTTIVNIGSASSSAQNWNFSSLLNHYQKVAIYSPTAPYQQNAADFPGSNMYTWGPAMFFTSFYGAAPVDQAGWGYMYWKTDPTGFRIVGFRGDAGNGYQNVLEAPQELLMGTPSTLNSTFNNSATWTVALEKNPFDVDTIFKCYISKVLECDAFGSLTTAFGTNDVIRVHEYVVEVDSVFARMGPTLWPVYQLRDTVNNYHFWGNDVYYPLAIVHADKNNNIKDVEYLIDTIPVYQITGNVFRENGISKVTNGEASLFIKDSYNHLFYNLENVAIDDNGNFQFANVLGPNYLVLADPDPIDYPYLLPTYYGDSTYWETATTLTVLQNMNISINCQSDSLLVSLMGTGTGVISGTVWMDTTQVAKLSGPQNSAPARGVKVTLEQNPGGACRISHTNNNGYFEFNDLPAGNYAIKVDIPGLIMDSTYHVNLSAKSMTHNNLDFLFDTTFIYIIPNAGIEDINGNPKFNISIYPNPFTDYATIDIENPEGSRRELQLNIYDMTGRLVKSITETDSNYITFNRDNLVDGMYLYQLTVDKEQAGNGKIIVK